MKVVVAGAGETGVAIAVQFSRLGNDVVLIDDDDDAIEAANEVLDVLTVTGNVVHRQTLKSAEVSTADAFVAVTGRDAENVVAAGIAKKEGARVAIARVDDPHFYASPAGVERGILGIDAVLCATRLAAWQLLALLPRTELATVQANATHGLRVAFAPVRPDSPHLHRAPSSIPLPKGAAIAGVSREGFLRATTEFTRLEADDVLLVVAQGDVFLDVWTVLFPDAARQRVVIVGGGDMGEILATALSSRIDRVDLVEIDAIRAREISERVPNADVTTGDARKREFLRELGVDSAAYFLAVTQNDEVNLLVSLLGRRLGADSVFTVLRQPGHAELFGEVGVEGATGAFELLAQTVYDLAVPEGLIHDTPLSGTGYTLLEWRCPERGKDSPPVVADVPLTPSATIIGIGRDAIAVEAARQTGLKSGDTLLIVVSKRERDDLVKRMKRFNREGWR